MKRSSHLKPIPKPDVKVEVDIKDVGGCDRTGSKERPLSHTRPDLIPVGAARIQLPLKVPRAVEWSASKTCRVSCRVNTSEAPGREVTRATALGRNPRRSAARI